MQERTSAKYLTLKRALLEKFENENFTKGQKLPTELELIKAYNVSRTTIRSTLALLEEEGIVVKRQGSGTFYAASETGFTGKTTETGLLGVLNCSSSEYIYPEIMSGIENTLSESGFSLVIANTINSAEEEIQLIGRLKDQGVQGLFLEPSRNLFMNENTEFIDLLHSLDIPVVTTHCGISNMKVSTVSVDDIEAGYEATHYLLDKGHRKIGYIYPNDNQSGHDRKLGFYKAFEEAGIPVDDAFILSYASQEASQLGQIGYHLTRHLLNSKERPTALFYFNDQIAIQGYMAIYELGMLIPDDVSVIGFDNYTTSEILFPPLTTFEHPKYQLGCWAAKIMLDKIENPENILPVKINFEPLLIERKSVKALKKTPL